MSEKIRKRLVSVCVVIVFIGLMLLVILKFYTKHDSDEPKYVFSFAINQTADFPTTKGVYEFARLVNEKSDSKMRVVVKSDGEFGTDPDVIKQIVVGGIDMASVSVINLTDSDNELRVFTLPYLFVDKNHLFNLLDSEKGYEMLSSVDDDGLIGLGWFYTGTRDIFTVSELPGNDILLYGKDIRVQDNENLIDAVKILGGNPVLKDSEQLYSALESAEIYGAEGSVYSYNYSNYYQVAPHFYLDDHTMAPEMIVFSKNIWQKLSLEDRKIIMEAAREAGEYERRIWDEVEEDAMNGAIDNGAVFHEISSDSKSRLYSRMLSIYEETMGDGMDVVRYIHGMAKGEE